jgi:hypothetical protein
MPKGKGTGPVLEHDIRQAMLHGAGGKAQGLTVADTGLLYMNRPGGLKSYDLWRLDQLNDSRRRLPRCEGRGGSSPEVGIVGFDCRNGLVMVHQTALPPTLAPRLVSRQAAAAYVCVSTGPPSLMAKGLDNSRPFASGQCFRGGWTS